MTASPRAAALAALAVPLMVLAAGCSQGPPMGRVRGQVAVDGKPVEEGVIRFVPLEPGFPGAGGPITGGRFDVTAPATRNRVEVNAPRLTADKKVVLAARGRGEDAMAEELIPPRYNLKSELVVEVKTGDNTYDLDLRSK